MPTLSDLDRALAPHLDADRYHREGDPAGVWIASGGAVTRLGLRLDAGRAPYGWLRGDVDALLVHRPFGLWPARLPDGLGVIAVHRALDDRFSTGFNPHLAEALGFVPDAHALMRGGDAVGMTGAVAGGAQAFEARLDAVFGGHEDTMGERPEGPVGRVAVVGAMTEALVLDAAERGVRLYVTGQIRKPAAEAVRRSGMRVVALGQDRAERWGLRRLGALLAEAFPGVEVVDLDAPTERP